MELTTEPSHQPPPPTTSNDGSQIEEWLALTDYAAKYRVSVSTLRRRIKANQISHRFIDGKYLLLDSRPAELDHGYHQQQRMEVTLDEEGAADFLRDLGRERTGAAASPDYDAQAAELTKQVFAHSQPLTPTPVAVESAPISSQALLEEIKHAYTRILQEKEEQIIRLKEEVTDLHTLVRVLEDDNNRMRGMLGR